MSSVVLDPLLASQLGPARSQMAFTLGFHIVLAAPSATLTGLLIVFGVAVLIVIPAIALLVHARAAQRDRGDRAAGSAGGTLAAGHEPRGAMRRRTTVVRRIEEAGRDG